MFMYKLLQQTYP